MEKEKSFLDSLAEEMEAEPQGQRAVHVDVAKENAQKPGEKPGSYQQEVFHRIEKPKKDYKKIGIISILTIAVLGVAIWFLFLAPKITMPDFQGKTLSDISGWAKQHGIVNSSVVVKREYNFENEQEVVLSQDKKPGTKIYKNTPLTFVISDGANPEEAIKFPDIKTMSETEIKEWIEKNKLSKSRVTQEYNPTVETGRVVSYKVTGSESDFQRGTSLNVVVSKGPAPLAEVTIENYVGKTFEEFRVWAEGKKLEVVKEEGYSKEVESGKIISQSLSPSTIAKEGDKIIVVVSKGEAILMPNLVGYTASMFETWKAQNPTIKIVLKDEYNQAATGTVIAQSISSGTRVEKEDVVVVTVSAYMPQLMTNSRQWIGKDYLELYAWVDDVNGKGANIAVGNWDGEICPTGDFVPGQIQSMRCMDKNGNQLPYAENGCSRPLPLDAKISLVIAGKNCPTKP